MASALKLYEEYLILLKDEDLNGIEDVVANIAEQQQIIDEAEKEGKGSNRKVAAARDLCKYFEQIKSVYDKYTVLVATEKAESCRDVPDVSPLQKMKIRVTNLEGSVDSLTASNVALKEALSEMASNYDKRLSAMNDDLATAHAEVAATKEEVSAINSSMKEIINSIFELNGKNSVTPPPAPLSPTDSAVMNGEKIELPFQGECFDTKGLVYFVGTQRCTTEFVNPHEMHMRGQIEGMVASMSGISMGTHSMFLTNCHLPEDGQNYTTDVKGNSWMKVDIGKSRKMVVDHYCLRHGYDCNNNAMVSWLFQGSSSGGNDLEEWHTIRSHENDNSLVGAGFKVGHWAIERSSKLDLGGYRYFRILQRGLNDWGHHRFMCACAGIELYGTLHIVDT